MSSGERPGMASISGMTISSLKSLYKGQDRSTCDTVSTLPTPQGQSRLWNGVFENRPSRTAEGSISNLANVKARLYFGIVKLDRYAAWESR